MNVLSLFSGIGGLDLGLERAGMTVVGQVEIDPWCRQILSKHWPEVPRHDDVRTAAEWWLGPVADTDGEPGRCSTGGLEGRRTPLVEAEPGVTQPRRDGRGDSAADAAGTSAGRPAVDLVCGGFPCQPVSLAGKGLAQADSRWLWPAFAQVIRHLGPRFVLVENVPGLLGRGMGDVLGDLAGLGYDAEWDCIPAAFVGAPHIRNRVWIVAYPVSNGLRQQPVTEPRSGRQALAAVNGQDRHVADTERLSSELRPPKGQRPGRPASSGDALADAASARPPDGRTAPSGRSSTSRGLEPQRLGRDVADAAGARLPAWSSRAGRQIWHRARPESERRGWWAAEPDVGRVAHGIPRRVDRLRGLGNAVVPQVAEHIGRLIMEAAA